MTPKTRGRREPGELAPAPARDALHEAALAYLTRGSATAAMLGRVLQRKVSVWARRAQRGGGDPEAIAAAVTSCQAEIEAILCRFREVGLVDDAAYAQARARSLARSGRSRRAIASRLAAKGVDAETVRGALPEEVEVELAAAITFAKKRRVGPYARDPAEDRDEARAEKQRALGALGRAGFGWSTCERVFGMDREQADLVLESLSGALNGRRGLV